MFRQNNKLIDALYFLKKLMILVKKINIIKTVVFIFLSLSLLLFYIIFFVKNIQFFLYH
jgi:hypothetical protein